MVLQISENLEWDEKINKQTKPPVHLDNDCLMYMTNLLLLLAHCLITDSHISDNIIWTQSKEINGLRFRCSKFLFNYFNSKYCHAVLYRATKQIPHNSQNHNDDWCILTKAEQCFLILSMTNLFFKRTV